MWFLFGKKSHSRVEYFCSVKCLYGRDNVIDPTKEEIAAMQAGGVLGGEYLEHLGRSDVGQLSEEEWNTFIECVVTGYVEALQKLTQKDPPF